MYTAERWYKETDCQTCFWQALHSCQAAELFLKAIHLVLQINPSASVHNTQALAVRNSFQIKANHHLMLASAVGSSGMLKLKVNSLYFSNTEHNIHLFCWYWVIVGELKLKKRAQWGHHLLIYSAIYTPPDTEISLARRTLCVAQSVKRLLVVSKLIVLHLTILSQCGTLWYRRVDHSKSFTNLF